MSIDTVGDFLTAIRNALMISKRTVAVPYSKLRVGIAEVLVEEGYVREYRKVDEERGRSSLVLNLKYVDGESVIHEIKRISKPGRRHYENVRNMRSVIGNLGISILSTNAGIVTDKKARELSVGGEVLCHVW